MKPYCPYLSYCIVSVQCIFISSLLTCTTLTGMAQKVDFPDGANVLDVTQAPYLAAGDGVTDDTEAIQAALDDAGSWQTVYLPGGTYVVSSTLTWDRRVIFTGQGKQQTIIKLQDGLPAYGPGTYQPVIRCYFSNNETIANWIEHLTVNTGTGNPGAIAVQFNSHNQGAVRDVAIVSEDRTGAVGLYLAEDEIGPHLVKNVSIEGFDYGILLPGTTTEVPVKGTNISSVTFENINLSNQNTAGLVSGMPIQIRKLTSVNQVPAIINSGFFGPLMLLEADLRGGNAEVSAIENTASSIYLRDVSVSGYRSVITDDGKVVAGTTLDEYIKGEKDSTFESPRAHLKLPIEETPESLVEPTENWAVIAYKGNGADHRAEIQEAIDSGAKTLFFPYSNDNRYFISGPVFVRANVERIVGMFTSVGGDFTGPQWVFEGTNPRPLTVEFLRMTEAQHTGPQTVFLKSSVVRLLTNGPGAGKLLADDYLGRLRLDSPQNVWLRQYNAENQPNDNETLTTNGGGTLWVLGFKTEWLGVKFKTTSGGFTELLGGFFRNNFDGVDNTYPYFVTEESSLSASYFMFDFRGGGASQELQAVEIRNGEERQFITEAKNLLVPLYSAFAEGAQPVDPPRAPQPPNNLEVSATSATSTVLTWKSSDSTATNYAIERKSGSGSFVQIGLTSDTSTSYLDEGLTASTTYTYRVSAVNTGGASAFSEEATATTTDGSEEPVNLALNGAATQSSTTAGGVASRAIDGNTNGNFSAGSVTHTEGEFQPYWEVDLGEIALVNTVKAWNRTDACCRDRTSDFYVLVSEEPFESEGLDEVLADTEVWRTFNEGPALTPSMFNVGASGRYVRIQVQDTSVLHLAEVEVIGTVSSPNNLAAIGETGFAVGSQANSNEWKRITLQNTYTEPVVVMGPVGFAGPHPATVRVRNTTANSFEYQIDEWDYLDGPHTTETISYLVVEAGAHQLQDGTMLVADKVAVAGGVDHDWASINFPNEFDEPPVVIAQCASFKDSQAVTSRLRGVGLNGFEVKLQEEERNDGLHAPEELHWVAVSSGSSAANYEASVTSQNATNAWRTIEFRQPYPASPVFLAAIQSYAGNNPAGLRFRSASGEEIEVKIEEETSQDEEVGHVAEVLGYLAFKEPGTLKGTPLATNVPLVSLVGKTRSLPTSGPTHDTQVLLYPNPATGGEVTIALRGLAEGDVRRIELIDASGKVLATKYQPERTLVTLSTKEAKRGLHFLRVVHHQGTSTQKLLIE